MCISQHFKHVNIVPYSKRQLKDKIINCNLVFSLISFDVGFFSCGSPVTSFPGYFADAQGYILIGPCEGLLH